MGCLGHGKRSLAAPLATGHSHLAERRSFDAQGLVPRVTLEAGKMLERGMRGPCSGFIDPAELAVWTHPSLCCKFEITNKAVEPRTHTCHPAGLRQLLAVSILSASLRLPPFHRFSLEHRTHTFSRRQLLVAGRRPGWCVLLFGADVSLTCQCEAQASDVSSPYLSFTDSAIHCFVLACFWAACTTDRDRDGAGQRAGHMSNDQHAYGRPLCGLCLAWRKHGTLSA